MQWKSSNPCCDFSVYRTKMVSYEGLHAAYMPLIRNTKAHVPSYTSLRRLQDYLPVKQACSVTGTPWMQGLRNYACRSKVFSTLAIFSSLRIEIGSLLPISIRCTPHITHGFRWGVIFDIRKSPVYCQHSKPRPRIALPFSVNQEHH